MGLSLTLAQPVIEVAICDHLVMFGVFKPDDEIDQKLLTKPIPCVGYKGTGLSA